MSLKFENSNKCLIVTHCDLAAANSFSLQDARDLDFRLNISDFDSLLWKSSHPRVFCSGGHLKFYANSTEPEDGIKANQKISKVLDRLFHVPVPTAVAVSGDAFGGGVELISCFDRVVIEHHVLVGLWQRRIALSFGWGGRTRLEQRVSSSVIQQLLLSAKNLSAYESARFGICDEVVGSGLSEEFAMKWLEQQVGFSSFPIEKIKNGCGKTEQSDIKSLWFNPDHKKILKKYEDS